MGWNVIRGRGAAPLVGALALLWASLLGLAACGGGADGSEGAGVAPSVVASPGSAGGGGGGSGGGSSGGGSSGGGDRGGDDSTGLPLGPPTVVGTVVSGDEGPRLAQVEEVSANDPAYYAGGLLGFDERTLFVDGASGATISQADVFDRRAELWLGGCAESYPVQCPVVALRTRP